MQQDQSRTPAVIYGCKSSPDERESVADQHRLIREAIAKEGGRILVAEPFGEDNRSGFRRERGPALEAAMTNAIGAARDHGEAELWVWHSSRLARGDGTKGKRSIQKVVADLLYENVVVRSVTDNEMATPMLSGIASVVSNKYSQDLSTHTMRGIRKRQAAGKPFGTMPFGYVVQRTVVDNVVHAERVIDPNTAPTVESIMSMIEAGQSWGVIARTLNARGERTRRGNPWTAPVIRDLAKNTAYIGEQGYPPMIERDRWDRIQSIIEATTPVGHQRRKGGRPVESDRFLLRGMAFCAVCGSPMHVRSDKTGYYTCREKRRGTGLCAARAIPAPLADEHVASHLNSFVGSVEDWLAEQVADHNDERELHEQALGRERAALDALERLRGKLFAEYERQVDQDRPTAYLALEAVERKDRELEEQRHKVRSAEARLAEWDAVPDVDAALDFYSELVDTIRGRIRGKDSIREVNAALSTVVAGIWLSWDGQRLEASFALRQPHDPDDVPGQPRAYIAAAADMRWPLDPRPGPRDPDVDQPAGKPRSTPRFTHAVEIPPLTVEVAR